MIGWINRVIESKSFIVHDIYQQERYMKNVHILEPVKICQYYMKNYGYDIKYVNAMNLVTVDLLHGTIIRTGITCKNIPL